jgi:hypothetical protein
MLRSAASVTASPIESFLPSLYAGRPRDVAELFAGQPAIDDPRHGTIEGQDRLEEYVDAQASWARATRLSLAPIRTTVGAGRSVVEVLASLSIDGTPTELPIAVAADHGADRLAAVRVYHSNWPLEGRHRIRSPLLEHDPDLVLPDVVGAYMDALASADLDGSLAAFEPDGTFREPSGGRHEYRGVEGIRAAYGAFYRIGPIHLLHCTAIDDGVACGVEFNAIGWGPRRFEPQAGIGVYERGRSGRLAAARVYDDVDVDLGLQPA